MVVAFEMSKESIDDDVLNLCLPNSNWAILAPGQEDMQPNLGKLPIIIVHLHNPELFCPLLKFVYGISEMLDVC